MKRSILHSCVSLAALSAASALFAAPVMAADAPAAAPASADDTLTAVVVTASSGDRSKLNTSTSISSVDAQAIQQFVPAPALVNQVDGAASNDHQRARGKAARRKKPRPAREVFDLQTAGHLGNPIPGQVAPRGVLRQETDNFVHRSSCSSAL